MRRTFAAAAWLGLAACSLPAQGGRESIAVRGRSLDVYLYPAAAAKGAILLAPGDGGWRGFAVIMARAAASWGYDVYGIDTRQYLESFTGATTLTAPDVMADMRAVADWVRTRSPGRPVFVGWSEGAGLGVLAAAAPENKHSFAGLVAIGLPESTVLGWRWADAVTWVTRRPPREPSCSTGAYLPRIAPLPLAVIHSTGDEYTSVPRLRALYASAAEPKRLALVEARDHRFDGNREEFFRALRAALEWIAVERR